MKFGRKDYILSHTSDIFSDFAILSYFFVKVGPPTPSICTLRESDGARPLVKFLTTTMHIQILPVELGQLQPSLIQLT